MNLYLLTQSKVRGYDTFDSCVVCAVTEDEARHIHPGGPGYWGLSSSSWPEDPSDVSVQYLGRYESATILEGTVICASFNAG